MLPEKNYVSTLLKGSAKNAVHRESVPFRKLAQPKTIQGGQMKDYQLTG